jgi:hypothetical protein
MTSCTPATLAPSSWAETPSRRRHPRSRHAEAEDLAAPSPPTPVATTTAWATTRRLTRALQEVASTKTQGTPGRPASDHRRRCLRHPSRHRCERPPTWRCRCRHPGHARGPRPCGGRRPRADRPPSPPRTGPDRPGGAAPGAREEGPSPQLGDPQLQIPSRVVSTRARWPLRWADRSGVRWLGAAPITAVSSASIKAW